MSLFALLALAACDDTVFPVAVEPVEGEGWCVVESTIAGSCVNCHSAENPVAAPDLQTDPTSIVTSSSAGGQPYIVAGDPDASFFLRKISGDLEAGEGGIMPPTGALPDSVVEAVRTWITDGATIEACTAGPTPSPARNHPIGWSDPDEHGLAAKLHDQTCTTCHGEDLTGGTGPSCDTCHGTPEEAGEWREDCTYCHGGTVESTGERTPAPPRQIDGTTDQADGRFQAHHIHTNERVWASRMNCATCHVYPESVTSEGHMFDATPGRAEVSIDEGTWDGISSCTVSCHGPDPVETDAVLDCGSCHGFEQDPQRLLGEHSVHVLDGLTCSECHSTADATNGIARLNLHVNGTVNVNLPTVITQNSTGACTGTCHGEAHTNATW